VKTALRGVEVMDVGRTLLASLEVHQLKILLAISIEKKKKIDLMTNF